MSPYASFGRPKASWNPIMQCELEPDLDKAWSRTLSPRTTE